MIHSKLQDTNKLVGQGIINHLVQNWPSIEIVKKLLYTLQVRIRPTALLKGILLTKNKKKQSHRLRNRLFSSAVPSFFPADTFIDLAPYLHRRISTEFRQSFYKKVTQRIHTNNNFVSLRNWIIIFLSNQHIPVLYLGCACAYINTSPGQTRWKEA